MANHTWVCFGCRERFRKPAGMSSVSCVICGAPCHRLGTKIEAPPKAKIREWKKLRHWYFARLRALYLRAGVGRVRRKHWLEVEIAKHQRLLPDKQLRAYVLRLEEELRETSVEQIDSWIKAVRYARG